MLLLRKEDVLVTGALEVHYLWHSVAPVSASFLHCNLLFCGDFHSTNKSLTNIPYMLPSSPHELDHFHSASRPAIWTTLFSFVIWSTFPLSISMLIFISWCQRVIFWCCVGRTQNPEFGHLVWKCGNLTCVDSALNSICLIVEFIIGLKVGAILNTLEIIASRWYEAM